MNKYNLNNEAKQLSLLEEKNIIKKDIRPIHYLGSKLRILETIKENIDKLDPNNGRVCDLFSGSGTVAKYLSKYRPVTSVDIQEYSRVICSALIANNDYKEVNIKNFIDNCINSTQYNNLIWAMQDLINYEEECINMALDNNPMPLCELVEKGSILRIEEGYEEGLSNNLKYILLKTIEKLKKVGLYKSTDAQITRLFGGIYFSYYQSVQLDSITYMIEKEYNDSKDILMAAVLSTASDIVNTVGKQFAQPIKAFTKEGKPKKSIGKFVKKDREIDVMTLFETWIKLYKNQEKSKYKNEVYKMDYLEALDKMENISVVYADPPYTRYHYSRYYHVLETISLRDNPGITKVKQKGKENISRGIYREDRHQSPFSIKTKVHDAFENLFSKVRDLNADLVLSYSPYDSSKKEAPRLMTMEEIIDLAKRYFKQVSIVNIDDISHSKLNKIENNNKVSSDAEVLIICKKH